MKHILFVCTGNICRSPMAEGLLREMVKDRADITVSSAGVGALDGQPSSQHSINVLKELGIDITDIRSSSLTADLIDQATHIFAMTRGHQDAIEHLFPAATEKAFLVCEFSDPADIPSFEVPDPIGLGRSAYEQTRKHLELALPSLLHFIDQPEPTSMTDDPTPSTTNPDPAAEDSSPAKLPSFIIGADHGGYELKEAVVSYLREQGHEVEDIGAHSTDSVDYPDYAHKVCSDVVRHGHDFGILVCTSGIGMSITANRYENIRAAVVFDAETARLTRHHNNGNVLCLSGAKTTPEEAADILSAWINTAFDGGRHERRLQKIEQCAAGSPGLAAVDPKVHAAIKAEVARQENNIELIASENFASAAVRAAQGSHLTNKYAEGYPRKRWYGGCENVDTTEQLAIDRAKELFGVAYANVQPHSGSQANAAVYFALLELGAPILTMDLAHGGHLTHGHPKNFSGMFYDVMHYGVSKETETIDYDHLEQLAKEHQPKMITAGASAYSRLIDFERMRAIADGVGAILFVDMAHIAGLVAGGMHPSPVPHAHIVSSTTHKSLRGPRGGIILTNDEVSAKKIDSMVFPGIQGGPLEHVIAAKAVCFHEALQPEFKIYAERVVANATALADRLAHHGYRIVSGGTDNHVFMVDVRPRDLNGKIAQETLDKAGITVNKNAIPFDTLSPFKAGGIRVGSPAVTTRGMNEAEMSTIGDLVHEALDHHTDDDRLAEIRKSVAELNRGFPLP